MVGNSEDREHVVKRFLAISLFLRDNGLLARRLAERPEEIDDDYCIRSSDLTSEGLSVLRAGYDRWLGRIDRGGDPGNTSSLARELNKIRRRKE